MSSHPILRGMHDVGLAAWTGGSLNGAVGLNGAAASLDDPRERARASTRGWSRWAPVQGAALAAHYIGGAGLLVTDLPRVRNQRGVGRSTAIKMALEAAGLGVNAWSGVLNRKMAAAGPVPVQGATEPSASTPADVAKTQRQLKLVQWLNPAVGAALIAVTSWQGEQQRSTEVVKGLLDRAPGGRRAVLGLATVAGLGLLASRRRKRSSATTDTTSTTSVTTPYAQATPVSSGTSSTTSSTTGTTTLGTGNTGTSGTGTSGTGTGTSGMGTGASGMGTGTSGTGTGMGTAAGTAGGFSTGMSDSDTSGGSDFSTGLTGTSSMADTGTGLGDVTDSLSSTGTGTSDLDDLSTSSASTTDVAATGMTDDDALAVESDVEVIDLNEAEGVTKTSRVIAGPDA